MRLFPTECSPTVIEPGEDQITLLAYSYRAQPNKKIEKIEEYQKIVQLLSRFSRKRTGSAELLFQKAHEYRSTFKERKIIEYKGNFIKKIIAVIATIFQKGLFFACSARYVQVDSLDLFHLNSDNQEKKEAVSIHVSEEPKVEQAVAHQVEELQQKSEEFNPNCLENQQDDPEEVKQILENFYQLDEDIVFLSKKKAIPKQLEGEAKLFIHLYVPPKNDIQQHKHFWSSLQSSLQSVISAKKSNWIEMEYELYISKYCYEEKQERLLEEKIKYSNNLIKTVRVYKERMQNAYIKTNAKRFDSRHLSEYLANHKCLSIPDGKKGFYVFHVQKSSEKGLFSSTPDRGLAISTLTRDCNNKIYTINEAQIEMNDDASMFVVKDVEYSSIEAIQSEYEREYVKYPDSETGD